MKTGIKMTIVMVLFACLFLLYGKIGPASAVSGSDGRAHSVIKGDTLWDVTESYLANPFFWPKVWQYNPHIENPHLIYPGDQVNIPSPEELAQMGEGKMIVSRRGAPGIEGQIAYVGGYLVERDLFESSGFILPSGEDEGDAAIISTWEEKTMLTDRDLVQVNVGSRDGVKVGDLYQIVHVGETVVHPVTRVKLGKKASIQGILKLTYVEEKLSEARIIKAYKASLVGDRIRPYQMKPLIGANDLSTEDKSIQGVIVENTYAIGKTNLAVRDTVYIDVGTEDSVMPGDRFIVYRGGKPTQVSKEDAFKSGIEQFPPSIMGELVVLKSAKNTSTAVVVEELNEINPGDKIKYSPRSLPPIKKYDLE
jgi:hypothetical protein